MKRILALALLLTSLACAPKPATPSADTMSTAVALAAFQLLTQTAAAASPTPSPTETETATPPPLETPTLSVTVTPAHMRPITRGFSGCWFGPGPTYTLESNIAAGKRVDLLGKGSETGWYIIRNPYFHRPCWMQASNLDIDPGINLDALPVMTPGVPQMGQ